MPNRVALGHFFRFTPSDCIVRTRENPPPARGRVDADNVKDSIWGAHEQTLAGRRIRPVVGTSDRMRWTGPP
jgi:hypothetical protein